MKSTIHFRTPFDILFTASHQVASDVGFSAYAAGDYHHPNIGETIRFPYVMTNNGGYYNPSESVFTCPINGLYYFTFDLYSGHLSNGERTAVHIQRDDKELSEAFCTSYGLDKLYTQCGNSVVIRCDRGQRVFVTAAYSATQLAGVTKRSTFSGFLIHPDTS